MSDETSFDAFKTRELERIKNELAADGRLSDGSRRTLEALSHIRQLDEPRPRRRRWIPVALFAVTLGTVAFLFFTRVSDAKIELDAEVSELSFAVEGQHALAFPERLRELSVMGAQEIDVSSLTTSNRACDENRHPIQSLLIRAASAPESTGAVSLSELVVPGGTRLTVVHAGRDYRHQWIIVPGKAADTAPASITTAGAVRVHVPSVCSVQVGPAPAAVDVHLPQSGALDLRLQPFDDSSPVDLEMRVRDLALFRIVEARVTQRFSTLLSGTLSFDEVPGNEKKLRAGQRLRFQTFEGTMHFLSASGDRLRFRCSGRAADVYAGGRPGEQSLMPTRFEWLTATHGLSTLVGATLYGFGLVLALARWWGVRF